MKAEVIALEDLGKVMEEVAREIRTILSSKPTPMQVEALNCFFLTLSKVTTDNFKWLPTNEAFELMVFCGTWFDLGMLFGKSPELLVKILEKTNPNLSHEEMPGWLMENLKRLGFHGE